MATQLKQRGTVGEEADAEGYIWEAAALEESRKSRETGLEEQQEEGEFLGV